MTNECSCNHVEIGIDCTVRARFKLPNGAVKSDYSDIQLTGTQNGRVIFRKHIDEAVPLDDNTNMYYFPITRDDTRKLDRYYTLDLQIWWQSGDSAGSTKIRSVPVRELLGGCDDD